MRTEVVKGYFRVKDVIARQGVKMKGYRFILLVCGFIFFVFHSNIQAQEKYPNRPIELVVTFTPGGFTDALARIYSDKLASILKTRIIVVNRPGGGGIIGALYALRAKKDGYTLLSDGTALMFNSFSEQTRYNSSKDFTPLGSMGYSPNVVSVRSDSPFKTFGELAEYARKNPDKLKNADGGGLSTNWMNVEIMRTLNIKVAVIPFSGGGEAMMALLGGHVDMMFNSIMNLGPHIKAGKLRPLAITSKQRFPHFPEIPTTAELGYPDIFVNAPGGTFAPSGVPRSALNVLIPALEKTFKDPVIIKSYIATSVVPEYQSPEEFRKWLDLQMDRIQKILKSQEDAHRREK